MIFWSKLLWRNRFRSIPLKIRLIFGGKLDFEKLTTVNGNRVIVVFEKDEMAELIKSRYTHKEFQGDMRRDFGNKIVVGQNEVVYLVINTNYEGRPISQNDFSQWEKNKNWFHEETLSPILTWFFTTMLGLKSQFAEPTDEEFIEFCKNLKETTSFLDKNPSVCRYCIKKQCPLRNASFDAAALRKAIAAEKTSETTPG